MLLLLLHVGDEHFALDSRHIVEITPLVLLKKLTHAPSHIAGLFNYRGQLVPVIDLGLLLQGHPCATHLSTRIILIYPITAPIPTDPTIAATDAAILGSNKALDQQTAPLFGLIAERVMETISWSLSTQVGPAMNHQAAPYLGDLIVDQQIIIQYLQVEHLLPYIQNSSLSPGSK
ncbi:MAG TPA: chemotaxis protein CheW [Microcoleaceae cyanobacterium]|jgi:chemotaxis-related protein WspB